jgi:hypothetical protein
MGSLRGFEQVRAKEISDDSAGIVNFLRSLPDFDGVPDAAIERVALHLATGSQGSFEDGFTRGMEFQKERSDARHAEDRRIAFRRQEAM